MSRCQSFTAIDGLALSLLLLLTEDFAGGSTFIYELIAGQTSDSAPIA